MAHQLKTFRKESITVEFMVEQLRTAVNLEVEAVNDVDTSEHKVIESNLHRPGLALAGYVELFTYQRVQILGNTENQFLRQLSPETQREAFGHIVQFPVPCIFLTESNQLADELVEMATEAGIPLYRTPVPSTKFMALLRYCFIGPRTISRTSSTSSPMKVCSMRETMPLPACPACSYASR